MRKVQKVLKIVHHVAWINLSISCILTSLRRACGGAWIQVVLKFLDASNQPRYVTGRL